MGFGPHAPSKDTPIEPAAGTPDGVGVVRVHEPRFTHNESLILAGVGVYALMGLTAIFGAIMGGSIHIPAAFLPWVAAIAPIVPLFLVYLIHGLKTGQWAVTDGPTGTMRIYRAPHF